MFVKVVRKISGALRTVVSGEVEAGFEKPAVEEDTAMGNSNTGSSAGRVIAKPLSTEEGDGMEYGAELGPAIKEKQRALIDALPLDR